MFWTFGSWNDASQQAVPPICVSSMSVPDHLCAFLGLTTCLWPWYPRDILAGTGYRCPTSPQASVASRQSTAGSRQGPGAKLAFPQHVREGTRPDVHYRLYLLGWGLDRTGPSQGLM